MNKDNAKDYLPLVQALAEGKVIQVTMDAGRSWKDVDSTDFAMSPNWYRIKPEPREVWVTFNANGTPLSVSNVPPGYVPSDSRGERAYVSRYREVLE